MGRGKEVSKRDTPKKYGAIVDLLRGNYFIIDSILLVALVGIDRYLGYLNSTSPNWIDMYKPLAFPLIVIVIAATIFSFVTSFKSRGIYRLISIFYVPVYLWLCAQYTFGLILSSGSIWGG
jgi:hypothetical protein